MYSPSQTRLFQVCPMLWWLDRRWTPTSDDRTARSLGTAVAVGLEHALKARARSDAFDLDLAVAAAHAELDVIFEETVRMTREAAGNLARISLKVALNPSQSLARLMDVYNVVMVEEDLGGARPDLVLRRRVGKGLAVVDHKWSATLDANKVRYRLEAQETDPQLWDYAWRVGAALGEPVESVGFHLVTPAPKAATWYEPVQVDPGRLALWLHDAEQTWEDMAAIERGTRPATGRWTACLSRDENYGRCRFYDACHFALRDSDRMGTLYNERTS